MTSFFTAPRGARRSAGFTLIELLTVIAIIGILAAIIIPTVGKVRQTAKKAQCASNLRQLALGVLLYADENKGTLPRTNYDQSTPGSPNLTHWFAQIRNYVGKTGTDASNVTTGGVTALFQCPIDTTKVQNQLDNRGGYLVVSYLHMLPYPLTAREGGQPIYTISRLPDPSRHPLLIDGRDVGSAFYNRNDRMTLVTTTTGGQNLGLMHGDGANVASYDGSVKYARNPTWTTLRGFKD